MKKYMKFGLIAIAVVTILSLGITAVASAQSVEGGAEIDVDLRQIFVGKVAEILGLDEEQVADAMQQAKQEMMEEFQAQRLQNAIDEGLITEEEAEQIQQMRAEQIEALAGGERDEAPGP